MKVYLVGGAVRDLVMGLPVKDKDYVVVGSTIEEMLHLGFQQVGADFPVFLHPYTNEEYALARVERKTGKGYLGFTVDSNPNITINGEQHICLDEQLLNKFLEAGFNIEDDYSTEQLMEVFRRKDQ